MDFVTHTQPSSGKKGILLVNLGTPDSTSTKDVRNYLREFLSDPRVIDIPDIARFLLLNLIILPTRPKLSAKSYKEIWLKDGSPLLVYGKKVEKEVQTLLGDTYYVKLAMRYGKPSIQSGLESIIKQCISNIKIIPLFPQYASASTASVVEKVMEITKSWQNIPSIEFKNWFYDDVGFINAFAEIGKKYLAEKYDHILFSFHGLPERQIKNGDKFNHCNFGSCCETITEKNQFCYRSQSYQTAYAIAEKLNLDKKDFTICFQSRLGKTPWIKPYADQTIKELAQKGAKKLLVFSPSFVSDCLETSFEIAIEYNLLFKSLGGEKIQLVESLNDNEHWIKALANIIRK